MKGLIARISKKKTGKRNHSHTILTQPYLDNSSSFSALVTEGLFSQRFPFEKVKEKLFRWHVQAALRLKSGKYNKM